MTLSLFSRSQPQIPSLIYTLDLDIVNQPLDIMAQTMGLQSQIRGHCVTDIQSRTDGRADGLKASLGSLAPPSVAMVDKLTSTKAAERTHIQVGSG